MLYISTRGQATPLGFKEAVLSGLASDGGLYIPENYPLLSEEEMGSLEGLDYVNLAFNIMRKFIGPEISDPELFQTINTSYGSFGKGNFCPTLSIDNNEYLLELYHGPTLAFKDFAMQFIGNLFELFLSKESKRLTIVTATSGDTGSAAVEAFKGKQQVDLYVLFPEGRISDMQRLQITTSTDSNIFPIAIKGDFDDCQRMVKELFGDEVFRHKVHLSAVNSINWARILAQTVYYFKSTFSIASYRDGVNFSVPTGNFGDIYAGYVAKKMGLPINKLIIASNQNDILQRTLKTGVYDKKNVTATIAPSMDIQVSSNFERLLFDLFEGNQIEVCRLMNELLKNNSFKLNDKSLKNFRENFYGGSGNDQELKEEISFFYENFNKIICPHTAAGTRIARQYLKKSPETPMISLATAHPSKFNNVIDKVLDLQVKIPSRLKRLLDLEENFDVLADDVEQLKQVILDRKLS